MEKRLTTLQVAKLTEPGRHADGGNLYLFNKRTFNGKISRCWSFKYDKDGRAREMGLGPVARVSLAQARAKAAKARELLDQGIDPLDRKEAAAAASVTFRDRAHAFLEAKGADWNPVHRHQWKKAIGTDLAPIADMPVGDVTTADVLRCLTPIWQRVPDTARKTRGKIEAVLDSATALGLRTGPNPAAWRGHLALILPGRGRGEQRHHAAMDYDGVAEFIRSLRAIGSVTALALEFAILTACRSGEVRGAKWEEIDLVGKTWGVPGSRMKSGREHRVPLSDRALAILEILAARKTGDVIFTGIRTGSAIGKTTMSALCPEGATVHGFRSSFRDWAGDRTIAEHCLAHATGDSTERAYRRGDAMARRRDLMAAWAAFCEPGASATVIRLRGGRE